ncbi:MAG: glycosyltransferase family 10 domain-containing protein [Rhodoferax sp.]
MAVRIFVPPGHFTITARFSAAELGAAGVEVVDDPGAADVVVAALVEELLPYMQQYRRDKHYLVWCDEPLWSMIYQRVDRHQNAFVLPGESLQERAYVVVEAMNCFTGNVLFCNHHFLLDIYQLDAASLERHAGMNPAALPPAGARRVAAFLTYRNGGLWNFRHPSGVYGLNTLRSRIALEGRLFGQVDVYGQGWPHNLALAEDAALPGEDVFAQKIRQYGRYKFALCLENTWSPYYVTEKIWQAILAGCLPIYHAGPQHTIYQDFAGGSFIDNHDFEHPTDVLDFVNRMDEGEFNRRMALCRESLFQAVRLSRSGQAPRRLQLQKFAERVAALV